MRETAHHPDKTTKPHARAAKPGQRHLTAHLPPRKKGSGHPVPAPQPCFATESPTRKKRNDRNP
ncbi:hypothetical protein ICN84_04730 [Akkermansia glycaniphila]|uniref:hypothetical protein n=1 Tax=Akkermansia glycaniphila TaxID=1679444 RepID=UPI001C02FE23|nr:hypothetical protein [Akkermansia glycaniphila]MBT9449379.1 hypothetical protein [Akkermansia glycaniphila]